MLSAGLGVDTTEEYFLEYLIELNKMLTSIIAKSDSISVKYFEIFHGFEKNTDFVRIKRAGGSNMVKWLHQIVKNLINITIQTSIKSICICPIKLSQNHLDLLKFWFDEPFGEYLYLTKQERIALRNQTQYPFAYDMRQMCYKYKLVVSKWGN